MDVVRTHDKMYLSEDRKKNPKECFKFCENIAREHLGKIEKPEILDVGCATGDQLWFLSEQYPSGQFTGIDVMPELLERAAAEVPKASFHNANIFTGENLPSKSFDGIFMSGVNSIFDELDPWMNNLLGMIKPGGQIFIFGLFNPEDIDVLIKSRAAGSAEAWETGWNVFSKKSYELFLESKGLKHDFHDFDLGIDLAKNPEDPLRSWTEPMANGRRMVVNGLQLVHTFSLLRIFC